MKNNRKGVVDPGQILIFVVVVGITAGFVYAVYRVGGQTAAEILFRDELSSISLVSDAVVNSPSCLMHMETRDVAREMQLIARRGVIDWGKVSDYLKGCVRKGPYVWNLVVEDKSENDKKSISEFDPATCKEIGKRSIPVTIKRMDKFNQGLVKVSIASKDAIATIKKDGENFEIKVINTGICVSQYEISASIVDSTNDQLFRILFTDTTQDLKVDKSATFTASTGGNLAGRSLKVEINPTDIPSYKKIYREKL